MNDHQMIQGVWRVESGDRRGSLIPVSPTMFGSKLLFQLNQQANPKEIDLAHRRPRGRANPSAQGIYALEGDTLRICWTHQRRRPRTFAANPEAEVYLMVLHRLDSEQQA